MIRTLVIVAIASFVLALICLVGVVSVSSRDLAANGWVWPEKWQSYGIHINEGHDVDVPSETRDLVWTGGSTLQVDLEGEVTYTQGDDVEVRVSGPAALLQYVALEDGRLFLKTESESLSVGDRDQLRIQITAPAVRRFVINGSPTLTVSGYDQENLTVEVNGSGKTVVEGRTDRAAVTVSGSGEADLGNLQTGDANVKVVGSGEAKLAPIGAVQVAIAGSGDVYLLQRPASLASQVDGSGEVHEAE